MSTRQRAVLAVTSVAGFMVFLDLTVVNIAFPSISASFPAVSRAHLSWVLSAYSIVFAALLIPGGRVADVFGSRRTFMTGLLLFLTASACCALAPGIELLIVARIAQAAGGALVVPTAQALLMAAFPPERRGTAVGLWSAGAGVAAALGPPLGGLLVQASSWRLVFLANLPVGAGALMASRVLSNPPNSGSRTRLDLPGAVLVVAGVGSLALGIVQGRTWGWGDARIVTTFSVAVVALSVLAIRCATRPDPIIDPALLRIRNFLAASAGTVLLGTAFFAFLLGGVLFLTGVWHYDALKAGLGMTPTPVVGALTAVFAGRLLDRTDPRLIAVPGAACLVAAPLWISAHAGPSPDYLGAWLPGATLAGAAAGFGYATLSTVAVLGLPPSRFAAASGVSAMTRQLGMVLGVASLVAVLGTPGPGDTLEAFRGAWRLVALGALAGVAMTACLGPRPRIPVETAHAMSRQGRS